MLSSDSKPLGRNGLRRRVLSGEEKLRTQKGIAIDTYVRYGLDIAKSLTLHTKTAFWPPRRKEVGRPV